MKDSQSWRGGEEPEAKASLIGLALFPRAKARCYSEELFAAEFGGLKPPLLPAELYVTRNG
jgi:hypothetical protein